MFNFQEYCEAIPFPDYFPKLYDTLAKIEGKKQEVDAVKWSKLPAVDKQNRVKQLEREKVGYFNNLFYFIF